MPVNEAICPTITDMIDANPQATPRSSVRILANFGAGVEHNDLTAAERAHIVITNTPDAVTEATADHPADDSVGFLKIRDRRHANPFCTGHVNVSPKDQMG